MSRPVLTAPLERTGLRTRSVAGATAERLRVVAVAGIGVGVLVAGLGSRLAMFLLRLSSPDSVRGRISDDGFVIGRVTLGGTYNLLVLGAAVGVIGAAAYLAVSPWLLGPQWFRRATTGLASAAVVGSMLVHADGLDFNALKPKWFAIGLFIALPGVFGVVIGMAVDRVAAPGSPTAVGRKRWMLPVGLSVLFPPVIFVLAFLAAGALIWSTVVSAPGVGRLRQTKTAGIAVRGAWLGVAVLGLVALMGDITALT